MVLLIGYLGDRVGLNETYVICNVLGIGTLIAVVFVLKRVKV